MEDIDVAEYRAVSDITVEDVDGNENAPTKGVWTYDVTVSFNANAEGATGTTEAVSGEIGGTITLPACGFEREGYTFAGWNTMANGQGKSYNVGDEITIYHSTATKLFAQWTVNKYTIKFVDENGTVLQSSEVEYGETPVYTGATPTKASTAQHSYTFAGWTPEIATVTGDATYTATFSETLRTYTVIWKNENGDILETDENVSYGTMPSYDGEMPTKDATAQYTYTFVGWDNELTPVTDNVSYTAMFAGTVNTYTVIWKNEDGTVLETDKNVPYGEMPTYDGENPTKAQTSTTTYAFSGWTPEIKAVEGDVEYMALFISSDRLYTVQWLDEDGTKLAEDQTGVKFDAELNFPGDKTPTKEGNAQYSYTFNEWIRSVDGDVIKMRASYTQSVNTYTVTWIVDGETVETDENVPYGTVPTYNGETPVKAATAQYTYTFNGWDHPLEAITGDVTYTATFAETVNKYTITWLDGDGNTLKTEQVAYGETPIYAGEEPTKAATAQYTYTFAGWSPEIAEVVGDATYTAMYTETVNKYTIKFVNEDGTLLQSSEVEYGTMPSYDGETPTKDASAQYTYTFTGWSPEIAEVVGDATYTAQFDSTVNVYTITWVDGDGNTLKTEQVAYGETPIYAGEEPTKAATAQYTYTFAGWSPEIAEVVGDATYTAMYTETVNKYTIKFVNEDGTLLQSSEVEYGTMPSYDGETPTKDASAQYTYTFTGWSPEIAEVVGDATYTAQFDSTVNVYTITWVDGDGNTLKTEQVAYGEMPEYTGDTPTKKTESNEIGNYTFSGWDHEITAVTGNVTYTATFKFTGLVKADGELWYCEDGDLTPKGLVKIGDDYYYIKPNCTAVRGTEYYVTKTNGLMDKGVYTFDEDGKMVIQNQVKNGLIWEDGKLWYYVDNVRTHAGLILVNGYYYYIKSNGQAVTSSDYFVSNTNGYMERATHKFDAEGHMTDVPVQKDGLVFENGRYYYYVKNVKTHAGLVKINGAYYYINSSCYAVTNCDYYVSNTNGLMEKGTYHFGEDGKMVVPEPDTRTGLFEEDGELVYYENGVRTHAGLIQWEGNYYYIKSDGTAVRDMDYFVSNTNDLLPRGTYHFNADGTMVV